MKTLRILIIDHYDSYTNNILQLLNGVATNGTPVWEPLIIRFDQYTRDYFYKFILPFFDAIILSPGPGRPDVEADFGFNSHLIREAKIPILGICLGHQGIGTSFGADISHARNIKHGQVSQISHDGTGILEGIPKRFDAVGYNSLVLDLSSLPDDILPTAWTYDVEDPKEKVLMGIRHATKPIYGIQWHPESICSAFGTEILANFWRLTCNHRENCMTREVDQQLARMKTSSLPEWLLRDSVIATTFRLGSDNVKKRVLPAHSKAYQVKICEIGIGPPPEVVFNSFIRGSSLDGEAWLDSAKVRDSNSQNSFLAAGIFSLSYYTDRNDVQICENGKRVRNEAVEESYWTWLDALQSQIESFVHPVPASQLGLDQEARRRILQVGFLGHFGYELNKESLPGLPHDSKAGQMSLQPDAQLLFANKVLWFDHRSETWKVFGLIRTSTRDPIAKRFGLRSPVSLSNGEFDRYAKSLRCQFADQGIWRIAIPAIIPEFSSDDSEVSYCKAINLAKDAIREGDSYEMTLTTNFRASLGHQDPFRLYLSLRRKNPAPYSAYLNFPASKMSILSSSPERFISIDCNGAAEMKPIKGTIAVSSDPVEDAKRRTYLQNDIKELAENMMIVDLIRSDLHNVSSTESITVPELLHVESYETVHQLVTTIRSQIRPSIGSVKALQNIFPPGSMTGAPKLRSVQILHRIEHGHRRGPYSGCLGYLCVSGATDQSVVIRTIVRTDEQLILGAGGAITWLSEPDKEWQEVLVKANAVARSEGALSRSDHLVETK